MTIGFIGNPNCGKTTLFNAYTGANLKVANWPGVTVEKVEGAIKDHDLNIRLVDLPGTYSLTSYTMEEQVSRQFILSDEVDVIIDVADASALERNLYLTLQLLELGKPVVLALNMMDIVEKRGMEIDTHRLPEMLGIPVIPVSARKRTGLDVLLHAAAHHKDCKDPECLIHHHKYKPKHRHDHHSEYAMVYSDAIEDKIDLIIRSIPAYSLFTMILKQRAVIGMEILIKIYWKSTIAERGVRAAACPAVPVFIWARVTYPSTQWITVHRKCLSHSSITVEFPLC